MTDKLNDAQLRLLAFLDQAQAEVEEESAALGIIDDCGVRDRLVAYMREQASTAGDVAWGAVETFKSMLAQPVSTAELAKLCVQLDMADADPDELTDENVHLAFILAMATVGLTVTAKSLVKELDDATD